MGRRSRAILICASLGLWAGGEPMAAGSDKAARFETAKFFIEFNATDRDVGVQVFLGGDPWRKLAIRRPGGGELLDVEAAGSLTQQGVSEFFFESAEPTLDAVPLEQFLARFPEGSYAFTGETLAGRAIEGSADFHHAIPRGPVILSPDVSGESPPVVDPGAVAIAWQPVTQGLGGEVVEIVGYQVTVEQEEPARVFRIDVPASITRVTVPPEFFAKRGTAHGFEVLAIEANGNQTISAGEFVTSP